MLKKTVIIAVIATVISGCAGNFNEITKENSREVKVLEDDFKVWVNGDIGKLIVEYDGDIENGVIVISKDGYTNTYPIEKGTEEIITLNYGDGKYTIKTGENIAGDIINVLGTYEGNIELKDELAPFKGYSYNVDSYDGVEEIIDKVNSKDTIEFVEDTYEYITDNIEYDDNLADMITSGEVITYKTNIKEVLESGKGICLDQATLMAAVIRSEGIPTRIVYGQSNEGEYHAWVDVYIGGEWRMYDTTLRKTYNDAVTKEYKVENYY